MKIAFHGAAHCVTGSKHLITLDNGKKVLLDCGMFQGMGKDTDELNRVFGFDPKTVNAMILSHAHIDHTGLIPKLCKEGFSGKIFCTPATKDLTNVLLQDSAHIQEEDVKFINKKRKLLSLPLLSPLYTVEDAKACVQFLEPVEYNIWFDVLENVQCMFTDAGHIIGSEVVNIRINENGNTTHITFSGDVGRYRDMILRPPDIFPQADFILMESTYGNSLHDADVNTPDLLLSWIEKTCLQKKGKLIMPAFSVGRTQELLFSLNQPEVENRLPKLDYYVDSPLSIQTTEVVKKYPKYFNEKIQKIMETDKDPFSFSGLKFITTVEESKMLNFVNDPFVIIAASGMAEAGRIKHHISNNIENNRNSILLTGYCEPHSLGGRLLAGDKEVTIFGTNHQVHAEIGSIKSMSAHGDYLDLLKWLSSQDPVKVKKIFIVHGDYEVQKAFRDRLIGSKFLNVEIPALHSEVVLS